VDPVSPSVTPDNPRRPKSAPVPRGDADRSQDSSGAEGYLSVGKDGPGGGRQPDALRDALERRTQSLLQRSDQVTILQRASDEAMAIAKRRGELGQANLLEIEIGLCFEPGFSVEMVRPSHDYDSLLGEFPGNAIGTFGWRRDKIEALKCLPPPVIDCANASTTHWTGRRQSISA
jgi:hypothetical protein